MNLVSKKTALSCGVALVALACANAAWGQTKSFDLPSEDAVKAIPEFARQAGIQIVAPADQLKGVKTPALTGAIDLHVALSRLLEGTGIEIASDDGQTIVLRVRSKNAEAASNEGAATSAETVIVTGTRLSGANPSVPLKSYTSSEIELTGQTTIPQFLNTLPDVSVQSTQDPFSSFGGQTNVRIHGFPAGTTATLLNGRRLPASADIATDFDLNALPLGFIDRIDVLPTGSSAIYGGDAIAGVVNFVTKRDVSGAHFSASVGHADSYTTQTYVGSWGATWDKGSVSLVASYDGNDKLFGRDREIVDNADYSRFAGLGGTDKRSMACHPGNVFTGTAANLPGLSSPKAAIPAEFDGAPQISDFIPTAGTPNLCSNFHDAALIPSIGRIGVFASGYYTITPSIEVFTEILYSHVQTSLVSPFVFFNRPVPASNPFNPFGATVRVMSRFAIPSGNVNLANYFRPLVGLRGELASNWHWEIAGWRSQDDSVLSLVGRQQTPLLAAALASSNPATSLDPFAVDEPAAPAILAAIYPKLPEFSNSDVNVVDASLRGDLFELPAGPLSLVVGGEYEWQEFLNDTTAIGAAGSRTQASRGFGAVYAEIRVPVLAPVAQGGDLLDVTAAGRYDRYNDFGGKFTPQLGVEVRPLDGLLLRASYAEAFKAPLLIELDAARTTFDGINGVPDCGLPGCPLTDNVSETFGGNQNLKAETGRAQTVGAAWSGDTVPGLFASLDYWWLAENNRITSPTLQAVLENPAIFPGRVTRDSGGVLTSVDISFANFGALKAEGLDLNIRYSIESDLGVFTPGLDWVMTTRFESAIAPGQPLENRLSQATDSDAWAVRNKATLSLDWKKDQISAHIAARYLGPYRDYVTFPANTNRLGGYTLWDASVRFDLSDIVGKPCFDSVAATASIVNAFDKSPQYSNFSGTNGYDPAQADILGRFVRFGLDIDL